MNGNITPLYPDEDKDSQEYIDTSGGIELDTMRSSCLTCGFDLTKSNLYRRLRVCPNCRYHYSISARRQIAAVADSGTFKETARWIQSLDPLEFSPRVSYRVRILQDQTRTGLTEAAVTGTCAIGGIRAVVIVLDFGFLGGTMGLVVGEKVAQALELAARKKIPAVAIITSGGARIQEGVLSLTQMAKTVIAVNSLRKKSVPLISVLGNPATGQVLASFASLSDIILAEPGAHIGFAPFREIQEAGNSKIDFNQYSSETYFDAGMVDQIVDRENLKHQIASILDLISPEFKLSSSRRSRPQKTQLMPSEPWEMVQLSRHPNRPKSRFYIEHIFNNLVELHGDRLYGQDPSVIFGIARIAGESVVIIGQQKGNYSSEKPSSNYRGEILPEGFRAATRALKMAERFRLPVITFVDTAGPRLGIEEEHRGLANAIAEMIQCISTIETPIISVLIGEGGSEAALAFGVADRILMLQNAIYTPISPEQGARVELRDPNRAKDIARALKLTSLDCQQMGIIDDIVPEPIGGAHLAPDESARLLKRSLMRELTDLTNIHRRTLVRRRQKRFRRIGEYGNKFRITVRNELKSWKASLQAGVNALKNRMKDDESLQHDENTEESPNSKNGIDN